MTNTWIPVRLILGNKFHLPEMTVYLVRSNHGFILLDAGLNTGKAFSSMEKELSKIGYRLQDIREIYLTHYHLDHSGLAIRLQNLLSVDIHMTEEDQEILDYIKTHLHEYPENMGTFFDSFGVSHTTIDYLKKELEGYTQLLIGPSRILPVVDGEKIETASGHLEVVATPGHTPGHTSFLLPEEGVLFGGDFILRDGIVHVGIYPYTMKYNPLKDYLKSLRRVRSMNISMILPAHGEPIYEPGQRIDEVTAFVRDKIEDILCLLKKDSLSLSQICDRAFRSCDAGLSFNYFFVLTLSLAYLRYLEGEKLIVRKSNKSGIVFVA